MSAKLLDGKALALDIQNKLKTLLEAKKLTGKITLAVILIGDNPASRIYVKNKLSACSSVGINVKNYELPGKTSLNDLLNLINTLNADHSVHGILLQLPLPNTISKNNSQAINQVLAKIHPNKDVDGFNPYNMGKLTQKSPHIKPCTPKGIMQLLEHYNIPIESKNVTIVGASNIVGRPLALEMLNAGATVTICHKLTPNLIERCNNADILCCAAGVPNLITSKHIKAQATVIDVGITKLSDGSITGDVDYNNVITQAGYITPVPGGVGPMTVAMLLENTIECYQLLTNTSILNQSIK